jgi:hypothetical protein
MSRNDRLRWESQTKQFFVQSAAGSVSQTYPEIRTHGTPPRRHNFFFSETKGLSGMPTFLKPFAWVQSGIGKWRDPCLKSTQAFPGRFS